MHKIVVNVALVREVLADLTAVGFSPEQVKALIIAIKKVHDGPWMAPPEPGEENESGGKATER